MEIEAVGEAWVAGSDDSWERGGLQDLSKQKKPVYLRSYIGL